jgi:hypothetical protein
MKRDVVTMVTRTGMISIKLRRQRQNECEIENYNKDHSKKNFNDNFLECINEAQNLIGVEQIFGKLEEDTIEEEPVE